VNRKSYSLAGVQCQTEEPPRVRGGNAPELVRIGASSRRDPRQRMRHPRGLVSLAPKGDGGQVGGIRLHQQPLGRYETEQVFIVPLAEGDDAAERHVPSRVDRELSESV